MLQPVFGELTPEDIRILREEVTKIVKAENDGLEKRLREYVDLKFEILDTKFTTKFEDVSKQQTLILILVTGLIAFNCSSNWHSTDHYCAKEQRNQSALETEIKTLREKVELLEQTRLVGPH